MTLLKSIDDFLDTLWKKPTSQHNYSTGLHRFQEFMEARLSRPANMDDLYDMVLVDFEKWLGEQEVSGNSSQTYSREVTKWLNNCLLRQTLPNGFSLERTRALYKDGQHHSSYHLRDPQEFLDIPKIVEGIRVEPIHNHPLKQKTQHLTWLRNRAFMEFLYTTGARQGTARSLKIKQVRNADGTIREIIKAQGKGDKDGILVLNYPPARQALKQYLEERDDTSEWLFVSHDRGAGQPISGSTAWKIVHDGAKGLGLEFSPHDFRHFWAIWRINNGMTMEQVQKGMWHSSPVTTSTIYAHIKDDTLTDAIRNVPMP